MSDQRERYEARRQAATGLLRKVLDLHAPVDCDGIRECQGCDIGAYGPYWPDWPCSTAELVLED